MLYGSDYLTDGSQRSFDGPVSVGDVAHSIGTGLGRAALAGRVTTQGAEPTLVDTSYVIDTDAHLAIITAKDPEGLEVIRHSTAHLLAYAVQELYPRRRSPLAQWSIMAFTMTSRISVLLRPKT